MSMRLDEGRRKMKADQKRAWVDTLRSECVNSSYLLVSSLREMGSHILHASSDDDDNDDADDVDDDEYDERYHV